MGHLLDELLERSVLLLGVVPVDVQRRLEA